MAEEKLAHNESKKSSSWRQSPLLWLAGGLLLGLLIFGGMDRLTGASAPIDVAPPPVESAAPSTEGEQLLRLQEARNKALEEEIQRLELALRQDPCQVLLMLQNSQQLPLTPGVLPAAEPVSPERERPAAEPSPLVPPQTPANVGELMEQATVFVLALPRSGPPQAGSGFFVAPGVIATNRHVIKDANSRVLVGNPSLQGMRPARIIAVGQVEAQDFALLRAPGTEAIPYLRIGDNARRTQKISSWGFPSFITAEDPKLEALINGDLRAAPEVVYSEGVVSVVLDGDPALIVHTASLSQGNSGGPLIDEKGVAVGINTLIKQASESYSQSSMALTGKDLVAFMLKNGVKASPPAEQEQAAPAKPAEG